MFNDDGFWGLCDFVILLRIFVIIFDILFNGVIKRGKFVLYKNG